MIKRYKKKPVVIEAIQYNGLNYDAIESFVGVKLKKELELDTAYLAGMGTPEVSLSIETLEGVMKVNVDDYVIKGVKGEFYPCKPDIFNLTYELIK